ncbi:zinc-dependent alcohol dehydrogenase [Lachnoclostridium sp. Marseille-P6806]|uniref:zinc-dependent alcohol dehydrogenase n=1 Tax=Lachnoclostridium sp. Marseille-P6806 TaxID=2364793 RepID=UPI00103099C3|nr:zinc-binding dehydrogenase [Lachnoclostridium sp. Marseille-P6806]
MKAIVKTEHGTVEYLEIPEPSCGVRDVKIQVMACAICTTDLHIADGNYPWEAGVPLGHEYTGVIVETGAEVRDFVVGDHVAACMDGGFARYVVKREDDWVFHLPDSVSYEEGTLLEPLAAAANSVISRAQVRPMDRILITGPGLLGQFALQAAKLAGARVMVSGMDAERLRIAAEHGADVTVDLGMQDLHEEVKRFTEGEWLDTVIECSGSQQALSSGLALLRYDGQLIQVGIPAGALTVDIGALVYNNRKIIGSIAYDRAMWKRVLAMADRGEIDLKGYVSSVLPLDHWEEGFQRSREKNGFRVLLIP